MPPLLVDARWLQTAPAWRSAVGTAAGVVRRRAGRSGQTGRDGTMQHAAPPLGPGRPRRRPAAFEPDDLPAQLELLEPAAGRSAAGTTARRTRPDGTLLREYETCRRRSRDRDCARACSFPAWTFNGQVPGPDDPRDRRRSRPRRRSSTRASHPHTIHFHGWHPPEMDGSLPEHQVMPGGRFVYEFDAEPFGLHLYHCHAVPLKRHIHKGLYGVFIVDPKTPRAAGRRARA